MDMGYCERHHRVWWAEWKGKRTAFVKIGRAFRLEPGDLDRPAAPVAARPIAFCYRLHSEICPAAKFTRISSGGRERNGLPRVHAA